MKVELKVTISAGCDVADDYDAQRKLEAMRRWVDANIGFGGFPWPDPGISGYRITVAVELPQGQLELPQLQPGTDSLAEAL